MKIRHRPMGTWNDSIAILRQHPDKGIPVHAIQKYYSLERIQQLVAKSSDLHIIDGFIKMKEAK
jgi:hypothetical protein